jgi:hypothetical protein
MLARLPKGNLPDGEAALIKEEDPGDGDQGSDLRKHPNGVPHSTSTRFSNGVPPDVKD